MKKKKIIFALLALCSTVLFGVGVAACDNGEKQNNSQNQQSSEIDLTGEKKIVSNIEETVKVYSDIDVSKCYGVCNGYKFACKAEITTPSGKIVTTDSQYTVEEEGEHKIKLTSTIGGEKVEEEFTTRAEGCSAQGLFTCSNSEFLQDNKEIAENVIADLRTGAQFQLDTTNSSLAFKPVVDLKDLKGESLSSLIEFSTNVNSTNLPDLRGLRIVLTDVYDSTNRVGVTFTMSSTILWLDKEHGIEEGTASAPSMKAEWDGYAVGDSSTYTPEPGKTYAFSSSFMPQYHLPSEKGLTYLPIRLYYDIDDNAIYTERKEGLLLIYDLDNPMDSYGDFKGFTTGEVYVSIECTGTSGDIVFTKIGDYTFGDVTADTYKKANTSMLLNGYDFENMLTGVVGYAYPLPQALYADAVTTKLYKLDGEKETEIAFDGTFTPNEAGRYAITCTSLNEYGYETSVKGYFDVLSEAVEITPPTVDLQAKLLDVWKVPTLQFEGGIGELSLRYTLQKGETSYDVLPGDAFALDKKGEEVKLAVTATDAIGYSRTFTFPLTIDSNVMRFELLNEFDSVSVNAGTVLTVPDYVAIDYSKEDVSQNNVEITIRRGKTQILSVGDEIEVRSDSNVYYYAGETLLKTFSIRCLQSFVEGGKVEEQFTSSSGVSQVNTSIVGTVFTLSNNDATILMPYTLSSSSLHIQFSLFDDMLGSSVLIRLRSLSGQELLYELTGLGAEPTLYVNGEKTYCKVSVAKSVYKGTDMPEYLNREYYTYSFIVDGAKATLYNGDALRIATIDKWNDGLLFDGFDRGAVQLSFEVQNAKTNGVFVLGKVSNQGLTSVHLGKGEKMAPMIAFDGAFGSMSVEKDSEVVIPTAYVYDVFDPKSSATLSIMSPSGEDLLKKAPAEEYVFTASEYGIYYVSYDVRDSKGNTDTLNYLVVITDDVAPTLTVNGTYKTEYKGKVSIYSATATDNVDGELKVTIWVEKSDMTTREVQAGEKVSLEKGSYKIVYYAMDANGNFAVQRFEIQVK
ncbi:MAG: hypothetical protein IJ308_00510 [Clostridia bacterium]|nr:hypothetical protein [Clostridia bacterium]